mgnify:CR=1 FL=1
MTIKRIYRLLLKVKIRSTSTDIKKPLAGFAVTVDLLRSTNGFTVDLDKHPECQTITSSLRTFLTFYFFTLS